MELRTTLYGYNKQQFRYFINESEAKIVRRIFDEYLSGKTFLQIGNTLTEQGIVYYRNRTYWSKQAVRRVIENEHYAGDSEYPAIIDRETYQKANALRLEKGGSREKDSPEIHYLKYHTKCIQCGARISRKSHYSKNREAWNCINGCKKERYLDDKTLMTDIINIINKVIENPSLLIVPHCSDSMYTPSIKVQRDERTLNELLQKEKVTFHSARKLYFDVLSEQFDCCRTDKSCAVTDALVAFISECDPVDAIDPDLFKVILTETLVDEKGNIALRFTNDAVITTDERNMEDE